MPHLPLMPMLVRMLAPDRAQREITLLNPVEIKVEQPETTQTTILAAIKALAVCLEPGRVARLRAMQIRALVMLTLMLVTQETTMPAMQAALSVSARAMLVAMLGVETPAVDKAEIPVAARVPARVATLAAVRAAVMPEAS